MGKAKSTKTMNNGQEEMIMTPGGLRKKSSVHLIESGHHVAVQKGRYKKVHTGSGKIIQDFGIVPKKSTAFQEDIKLFRPASTLPGTPGSGWIVYSDWWRPADHAITIFATEWVVPPLPATLNNQLIYLFNGLQNQAGSCILQPVLQFGVSPRGGGNRWCISNWFVGSVDENTYYKPLIDVNPGDRIKGVMKFTDQSNGHFNYVSSFEGHQDIDLNVPVQEELVYACETLECYYLSQFSDYPDTRLTSMENIEIVLGTTEASLNWKAENTVTDNGQECTIENNASPGGRVDLHYRQ